MWMATLKDFSRLGGPEHGLVVVAVTRGDGSVQASVVNAGVLSHPDGGEVVGLVARGDALKLRLLRRRPRATVTVRSGWHWATVEGSVELAGPDDPHPSFTPEEIPRLLRDVFTAPAARTTTGIPMIGSWPRSAAPPSWCDRTASTAWSEIAQS